MNTRLPDFLVIGAQKAGTTWMRKHLRAHPDIFLPPKELHYFDHPENFERGPRWYAGHFSDARPDQVVGEKTPNYLFLPDREDIPDGARRVHDLLPDAKLVVSFRDPVDRAISALNHVMIIGEASPLRSADSLLVGKGRDLVSWPVIEMGIYHRQIEAFFELYGRDPFLVLFFEDDIVGRPAETLHRIHDFLGVRRQSLEEQADDVAEGVNRMRRSRLALAIDYHAPWLKRPLQRLAWRFPKYYPRVSDSARREMYRFFEPHNERLFELLGRRPASGWSYGA